MHSLLAIESLTIGLWAIKSLTMRAQLINNYSWSPHGSESIAHEAEGLMGY